MRHDPSTDAHRPGNHAPLDKHPVEPEETDDRWIADFDNDLGCFSLSSDGEEAASSHHIDELGYMATEDADPTIEPKHRHDDFGI